MTLGINFSAHAKDIGSDFRPVRTKASGQGCFSSICQPGNWWSLRTSSRTSIPHSAWRPPDWSPVATKRPRFDIEAFCFPFCLFYPTTTKTPLVEHISAESNIFFEKRVNKHHFAPLFLLGADRAIREEGNCKLGNEAMMTIPAALTATQATSCGETCVSGLRPASNLLAPFEWQAIAARLHLSPRELQIAQGFLDGLDERSVAERICISEHTVHTYLQRLYRKMGVNSRCEFLIRLFVAFLANNGRHD